jgi:hypothetical protein
MRSEALERMCQVYVGSFESNLVQLTAVYAMLERRISLNTRHEESVSPCELALLVVLLTWLFLVLSGVGDER